ncbi:MAG: hypothetical protein JSV33_13280 [bacterium]|nr:MAG: hypothetical protein JSV33_13280 [bacterium]
MLVVGTFVSAQQVSSETIFEQKDTDLKLHRLTIAQPACAPEHTVSFISFRSDTVETYDIEIEEDKGKSLYKEIAVFVIVAAMVGYMIITLIGSDEEQTGSDNGGKPGPLAASIEYSIPIGP